MKKTKKLRIIIILIILVFLPVVSKGAFYDEAYPPNSSGKADYNDEEADKQKLEKTPTSAEDYIGKSSNTYLKNLIIENATIEPAFNRQYVDYKLQLQDMNKKSIKIIAEAEDEKAIVEGTGEIEIQDGINNIRVVVKAENGDIQIYNFKLELPYKQSNVKLENLEIYGVNIKTGETKKEKLKPNFQSNIYEYTIKVSHDVNNLDIRAKTDNNSYVSIQGGNDLEVGSNTILIQTIDKTDENKVTTYRIDVTRQKEENFKKIQIIIIGIIGILVVIIALVIKKRKR